MPDRAAVSADVLERLRDQRVQLELTQAIRHTVAERIRDEAACGDLQMLFTRLLSTIPGLNLDAAELAQLCRQAVREDAYTAQEIRAAHVASRRRLPSALPAPVIAAQAVEETILELERRRGTDG